MGDTVWIIEREWGLRVGASGLRLVQTTMRRRAERAPHRHWPRGLWALPLLATAGIAIAMPVGRTMTGVPVLTVALDEPVPLATRPTPKRQGAATRPAFRIAPSAATIADDQTAGTARQDATPPVARALQSALLTGEPTDWADPASGQSGVVVVGDADSAGAGCRSVVVMTRHSDGQNANASHVACGTKGVS